MELIQLAVLISSFLCSLVAGFVLSFAIIVMPGIKNLSPLDYLKSFKAMDSVIQNNHPLFLLVWVGSLLALVSSTVIGIWLLDRVDLGLLIFACTIYILGVHLPTITINVPLNNRLQALDLSLAKSAELETLVELFQSRWIRWNTIRTLVAMLTSLILLVLLISI